MNSAELLQSLRSMVAYHRTCGLEYYYDGEVLEAGVERIKRLTEGTEQSRQRSEKLGSRVPDSSAGGDRGESVTIENLAREIQQCRICPLHESRKVSTEGTGGLEPDLLVVGDWLMHEPGGNRNTLFGEEQDLMLSRMITAIDLQPSQVFVTNVIKCSVPETTTPAVDQIETCLSYLKQQITILSPKVICTMGTPAAQTLLGSNRPLIGLRGRFHTFRIKGGKAIPLMPTFHPSYLLKNPEMKQPTWSDLQAVKKKLGELGPRLSA